MWVSAWASVSESASASASAWASAWASGSAWEVGVGAVTGKLFTEASESPSVSVTVRRTYLVSTLVNVLVILQPGTVSQTVPPVWSSKFQLQVSVPSPVEAVPSSVTGVPVVTPVGAVQIALAG